jgi:hypothetical protein
MDAGLEYQLRSPREILVKRGGRAALVKGSYRQSSQQQQVNDGGGEDGLDVVDPKMFVLGVRLGLV